MDRGEALPLSGQPIPMQTPFAGWMLGMMIAFEAVMPGTVPLAGGLTGHVLCTGIWHAGERGRRVLAGHCSRIGASEPAVPHLRARGALHILA